MQPISYTSLGIIFSVTGNLLISVSLNIQRQAHRRNFQKGHLNTNSSGSKSESYLHSFEWWIGFLLMTLGEVGNFVAYGFAPVSIVSPMGVVTIISNSTFVAPLLFHETVRPRDLAGTFIAATGVVSMVLTSLNASPNHNDDGDKYMDDPFDYLDSIVLSLNSAVYIVASCITILCFTIFLSTYKRKRSIRYVLSNLSLVALYGSYTAMATKFLSTILEFSSIESIFQNFRSYVLLLVIITTSVMQIKYLNRCLKVSNSTTVAPIHFVFFTTSVLIGSAVVFKDFADRSFASIVCFLLGALLTFFGVFCICGGAKTDSLQDTITERTSIYASNPGAIDTGLGTFRVATSGSSVLESPPEISVLEAEDAPVAFSTNTIISEASSFIENQVDSESVKKIRNSNENKFLALSQNGSISNSLQASKSTPEFQLNNGTFKPKKSHQNPNTLHPHNGLNLTPTESKDDNILVPNCGSSPCNSDNKNANANIFVPNSPLSKLTTTTATNRRKSIADISQKGWDILPLKEALLSPELHENDKNKLANGYFTIAGTVNVLMSTIFSKDDISTENIADNLTSQRTDDGETSNFTYGSLESQRHNNVV